MKVLRFKTFLLILVAAPPWSPESGSGAAGGLGQPCELTGVVGPTWRCGAWSNGSLTD